MGMAPTRTKRTAGRDKRLIAREPERSREKEREREEKRRDFFLR